MKVSKMAVTFLIAMSMLGTTANAGVNSRSKEIQFTKDKAKLSDKRFQLKLKSIRELTAEEALKYEASEGHILNKSFTNNNNSVIKGGFKIPSGVPGVSDSNSNVEEISNDESTATTLTPPVTNKGGNTNSSATSNKANKPSGDLAVGTGAGGNTGGSTGGALGTVTSVLDGIIMVAEKIVAIGDKIMPTIEKGRPAVTNKPMQAISVLPRIDAKDPVVHEMGNWSIPVTKHYKITYSNGMGSSVVSFVYSVTFQYGGTYGGKGKYLAGVRVSARDIRVDWGFDLDANSELIQISNVGTSENVVAGATIEITYTVKNVLRQLTTTVGFHVTGDGRIYKLD